LTPPVTSPMQTPIPPKPLLEKFSQGLSLLPGLSDTEISAFQKRLGNPLPNDISELLRYSAGFDFRLGQPRSPTGHLRFVGEEIGFPDDTFFSAVSLLDDGCGNYWAVDVDRRTGDWGSVLFICHDPPVIAIQARDLSTLLEQILSPVDSYPENALTYVTKEAVRRIWKTDPWLTTVERARISTDAVVSNFAKGLTENFNIADLRAGEVGSGFSWGQAGPRSIVRRGEGLLFGVEGKAPRWKK
jgi:hypothetical protein